MILQKICYTNPAILIDNYFNISAINSHFAHLINLNTQSLKREAIENHTTPNLIWLIFNSPGVTQTMQAEELKKYRIFNVSHFMSVSLRYRHTKTFVQLQKILLLNKEYETIWTELLCHPKPLTPQTQILHIVSPISTSTLSFYIQNTLYLTNLHDLYLIFYIPLNQQTKLALDTIGNEFKNRATYINFQ